MYEFYIKSIFVNSLEVKIQNLRSKKDENNQFYKLDSSKILTITQLKIYRYVFMSYGLCYMSYVTY